MPGRASVVKDFSTIGLPTSLEDRKCAKQQIFQGFEYAETLSKQA
jgi:hypothetical protein